MGTAWRKPAGRRKKRADQVLVAADKLYQDCAHSIATLLKSLSKWILYNSGLGCSTFRVITTTSTPHSLI